MTSTSTPVLQKYVRLILPYALAIILFYVFRSIVKDPWYCRDSWDYINCAVRGDKFWYRPLGYTTYLKFIHSYGGGYGAAIFLQFLLFIVASSIFLEQIFKIFGFQFRTKVLVWCLTIYNPFIFYLSNFLTTDSLFVSLTCLWMVSLINSFLVQNNRAYAWIFIHCCVYYFLFALRFNALYYPAISILAVLIYKAPVGKKMAIALLPIFVVLGLVKNAENEAKASVGVPVYSGLGSWAIANNAMHIYRVREVDPYKWDEVDKIVLHERVLATLDSIKHPKGEVTDQYMWHTYGPLKQYVFNKVLYIRPKTTYYREWFAVAPMYREFGLELIKQYPGAFLQSFYLPNLRNCIYPKMEILNFDTEIVPVLDDKARDYIKYEKKTYSYTKWQKNSISSMRYAFLVLNLLIILAIGVIIVKGVKNRKNYSPAMATLLLFSCFHILSVLLLAFVHPVWIRYLAFSELFMVLIPVSVYGMWKDGFKGDMIEDQKIDEDRVVKVVGETTAKDKKHKQKKQKHIG